MGMDGKAEKSIQGFEGKVDKRTGASSTGLKQKNEDGSGCIGLCHRRSVIYRV